MLKMVVILIMSSLVLPAFLVADDSLNADFATLDLTTALSDCKNKKLLAAEFVPKSCVLLLRVPGELVCWDMQRSKKLWQASLSDRNVKESRLMAVDSRAYRILVADRQDDSSIAILDLNEGKAARRLKANILPPHTLMYAKGEPIVMDTFGRLWEVAEDDQLKKHPSHLSHMQLGPGQRVLSSDGETLVRLGARNVLEILTFRSTAEDRLRQIQLDVHITHELRAASAESILLVSNYIRQGRRLEVYSTKTAEHQVSLDLGLDSAVFVAPDCEYAVNVSSQDIVLIDVLACDMVMKIKLPTTIRKLNIWSISPNLRYLIASDVSEPRLYILDLDQFRSFDVSTDTDQTLLLERCWEALAGGPRESFEAQRRLIDSGDAGVRFLRARLEKQLAVARKSLESSLENLTNESYELREQAAHQLALIYPWVADRIEEEIRNATDEEYRARLRKVVASPEQARLLRCLRVLARLDSQEADEVIQFIHSSRQTARNPSPVLRER